MFERDQCGGEPSAVVDIEPLEKRIVKEIIWSKDFGSCKKTKHSLSGPWRMSNCLPHPVQFAVCLSSTFASFAVLLVFYLLCLRRSVVLITSVFDMHPSNGAVLSPRVVARFQLPNDSHVV